MAVRVVMPTFGLTEGEATIVRWRKRVGESVLVDEPLFEAESEKASLEVPAPQSGVLLSVLTPEGEVAPLGEIVAWIGEAGEQTATDGQSEAQAAPTSVQPAATEPVAQGIAAETNGDESAAATDREQRIKASPIARRVAREYDIDLRHVKASGPGGRIVEADVRKALHAKDAVAKPATVAVEAALATAPATASVSGDLLPLTALRRITAERLAASARATVAVPLFVKVDMSEIQRLRGRTRAEYEQRFGTACSYNALILAACALTLPDYPALNGEWTERGVRAGRDVNIGLAVAVEDGLLVPVIHQANHKRLADLHAELHTTVELARTRALPPEKLANGTFTVSNLGHVGIDAFVPTINLPQTAILGIGRIAEEVVAVEGQPAVRPMATLCLVFDHRAVDGAPAAACLARIKQLLENPYLLA